MGSKIVGCSRIKVQSCLVSEKECLEVEAVTMKCAHGDVALYRVTKVELVIDRSKFQEQAKDL